MMPRVFFTAVATVVVLAIAFPAQAKDLTLERVFASPALDGEQPRALSFSPDGKMITSLRPRADDKERYDLWAMDIATGKWRMLINSKTIGTDVELSEAEKMQRERARIGEQRGIVSYRWSPDGRSILVPLDGMLYLATPDGKVTPLADTKGALNPVVSPEGGYVSFVRDQNLVVAKADGSAGRAITDDGAGTVHWGEAEFVAQEEMARLTGYWWSPDDKYIVVERFDDAPVDIVTRAAIGAEGTKVYAQHYPSAGTPNAVVDVYVMRPDGSGKVKVDLGSDRDIYFARAKWAPDSSALYIQRQTRDQTRLDVLKVDPATGASTILFTERAGPKSWINLSDIFYPLKDGTFLWWSERDGHGHLYRYVPRSKSPWQQLTVGDWDVADVVRVDEAHGTIFFAANKDGVLERHIYALDINGPREAAPVRLTETGWWNIATAAENSNRFIVTRSNPDQPTQLYLADGAGHRIAWIAENSLEGSHPYHPFIDSHQSPTFGTLAAADGTILHWRMLAPKLEPGRKYPVFFEHYGGPRVQTVTRSWTTPLHQFLVDQGYIVFQIDNRGAVNRGKAFEDAIWHSLGSVPVSDQRAGANYLKTLDFVDPNRIAIYGWSFGGYLTLKMLQANPGVYAAGIAGAPVTRWELYDTHYAERYLGTDPKGRDAAAYAAASAVADADKISDPLLLMHGMADDNAILDNSTAVAAKMQATNTPFEMMFYPGKAHSARRDIHVWTTILRFLDRTVGARAGQRGE